MLKQAMAAILVCGDKNIEENIDLIVEACSAATQNALLTVHDLGLGAVWISAYPVRETVEMLKSLFKYPENIIPISLISIGYPAEKVTTKERFNPGKVHYNVW
jgi:nitroreductase